MRLFSSLQPSIALVYLILLINLAHHSSYILPTRQSNRLLSAPFSLYSNKVNFNRKDKDSSDWSNKRSSSRPASTRPNRTPRPPSLQDNIKLARFARTIRDELSDIIATMDIRSSTMPDDDLFIGTSITDVEVSADMSTAKVTISVLGNSVEKRKLYLWLCDNVSQVRFSLAKRIRYIRRIPLLTFKLLDPQTAEMMNIMEEEAMRRQSSSQALPMDMDFEEEDEDESDDE
jgi:ribosome-binding factor A